VEFVRCASGSPGAAGNVARLLEACVTICKSCGDKCERHARMRLHCRVCGEACRDFLAAMKK
jgi:hypothetical protein